MKGMISPMPSISTKTMNATAARLRAFPPHIQNIAPARAIVTGELGAKTLLSATGGPPAVAPTDYSLAHVTRSSTYVSVAIDRMLHGFISPRRDLQD